MVSTEKNNTKAYPQGCHHFIEISHPLDTTLVLQVSLAPECGEVILSQ